jgi:NAD(P)-dependent dehydrogenase (short-subunit alcohol dehydrogenase family)
MAEQGSVVVVGGTAGIGLEVARHYGERGREVVLTGRDADRARAVADELGGKTRGIALDLSHPHGIAAQVADIGPVQHLVLSAIARDENTARDYAIDGALNLVTMKLVGYTAALSALLDRMDPATSSVVLFGGLAKERPYPGSTTVTTVNGGVTAMVRTLATELAPLRVNALHPGIVGDSPYWRDKPAEALERIRSRTPIGRLITMEEVVGGVAFLLENGAVNGVNLHLDGGWLLL